MAYIYGLRAADSDEYFYIGSTKQKLSRRFRDHKNGAQRGSHANPRLAHKMRKVGVENVVIDCLEECAESVRFDREYAWIKNTIDAGGTLTNLRVAEAGKYFQNNNDDRDPIYTLCVGDIQQAVNIYNYGLSRTGDVLHDLDVATMELAVQIVLETKFNDLMEAIPDIVADEFSAITREIITDRLFASILDLMP